MVFRCPICSAELVEQHARATCSYCRTSEEAEWLCPGGHFQCEECRCAEPSALVARACAAAVGADPFQIATLIMQHSSFTQAGPEHHLIVAPVVLAAMRNHVADCVPASAATDAIARAIGIPLGACASRGDCGGAVGAGIAVSIASGATPVRGKQRSMVLRASACASLALADMGGVRCCKQAVFCGIETAWSAIRTSLVAALPELARPVCAFSGRQKDCKSEACPYHA